MTRKFRQPRFPAFHVVTAGEPFGELRARKELGQLCEEPGKLFGIDELLGDDEYVFLSVGKPATMLAESSTCFLFDAEKLVKEGALVRLQDILMTEESYMLRDGLLDIQTNLFSEFYELRTKDGEKELSSSEKYRLNELEENLGSEFSIEEVDPTEMSAEQIRYFMRKSSKVRRAVEALKLKREQITLSGKAALRALKECETRGIYPYCEVLVSKRLSLFKAIPVPRSEMPLRRPVEVRRYTKRRG